MADDIDTVAETRELPPEPETFGVGSGRSELLPSIGHIGRYALKYKIGEGGLGTVFAAHDPLLSRLIAIKTLHVDLAQSDRAQFNALFLNEAKAAGSLNHPHIVTMYDAGTSEQGTYIAMELLRGKDLRQLLAMGWKPTPAQSAMIVRRVADALSYAHHKGVIHRDIKPANIFMVGRTQPRVLDFGIARIRQAESLAQRDDPQSRFQEIVGGSPYYMAPEQVERKPVDRRVDVYALGVVLYELLTCKRPFSGNSLEEIADAVLSKPVPLVHEVNPDVPTVLSEIVARAMHRDPEQRTRSARRLSAELRGWLDSLDGQQGREAVKNQAKTPMVARPVLWLVAAAGWLAALAGLGWFAWQSHHEHAPTRQAAASAISDTGYPLAVSPPATAAAVAFSPPPVAEVVPQLGSAAVGGQAASSGQVAVVGKPASNVAQLASEPTVAQGTLKLAISPWGEVLVDGREAGVAPPLNQLHLPAGPHVITIRNGDAPEFRQAIEVRSGKAVYVRHQF